MNAPLETQALFAKLSVGEASILLGVELVPLLLRESDNQADAVLLEEGIASGQTQVDEVGESGVVGQVRVLHRGGARRLSGRARCITARRRSEMQLSKCRGGGGGGTGAGLMMPQGCDRSCRRPRAELSAPDQPQEPWRADVATKLRLPLASTDLPMGWRPR